MAYNADETNLQTEHDELIKSEGLRTIPDPFLSEREGDSTFDEKGPYECPRCKGLTLKLSFGGFWD
jgi:hypothetical protein